MAFIERTLFHNHEIRQPRIIREGEIIELSTGYTVEDNGEILPKYKAIQVEGPDKLGYLWSLHGTLHQGTVEGKKEIERYSFSTSPGRLGFRKVVSYITSGTPSEMLE